MADPTNPAPDDEVEYDVEIGSDGVGPIIDAESAPISAARDASAAVRDALPTQNQSSADAATGLTIVNQHVTAANSAVDEDREQQEAALDSEQDAAAIDAASEREERERAEAERAREQREREELERERKEQEEQEREAREQRERQEEEAQDDG